MNSASPSPARQAYLLANRRQNRQVHLWQIALLLGLLALWELSCRMGLSDGFLTSCPSRMAATFASLCRSGDLWRHIGVSCGETVIGFLSGTAMGTVVAICMWWSGKLARVLDPYLVVLNALPKTALGPIFIVWMGAGQGAIIVMTLAISLIVTILNMYQGFLSTDGENIRLMRSLGASRWQILWLLVFPANAPTLFSTLKVNVGLSWVGVIMGEFLISQAGFGISHRLWLPGVQHGSGHDQRGDPGSGGGGDVPAGAVGGKIFESFLGERTMKKLLTFLLAALMIVPGLCACGKQDATVVRLNEVTHSVFYAPQYVAMSQGFFAAEGLQVELTNGGGADKVMTAVVSGQSDIGLAGPEASIYVYNQGKADHTQIIAQLTKRDGSFLVGRTESSFSWEDLRGKTIIGGRKGGVPEMTLEYVLRQNGLTPGVDVTVDTSVQFNMMAGAFTGGQGDYVALFEPTATQVEAAGQGYVLTSIGQESGEIPYTAYFANLSWLENNADTAQRFVNAIAKAQKWVAEHTDREVAEAIVDQFPDTSLEELEAVTARHRQIDAWNATPIMEQQALERLETVMEQAGELAHSQWVPFDDLVNNTFARCAVG